VDLEELNAVATGNAGGIIGLGFKGRKQSLEPLERAGIFAHPNEFHTSETGRRVRPIALMPNVLQNRRPRRDTDPGTNKNSNFVVEHVLSRGTVRAVNSEGRHLLAVLESHLVHAKGVNTLIKLRLSRSSTNGITKSAGEVADLTDMDRHVRIEWTRGNGERVPLVLRNPRDLEEEPLASFVVERGFRELDFDDIYVLLGTVYSHFVSNLSCAYRMGGGRHG